MNRFWQSLYAFIGVVILYNVVFALNRRMVECNEGGVNMGFIYGLHSCHWALLFLFVEGLFLVLTIIFFFTIGPRQIFADVWRWKYPIAIILVATLVVGGFILVRELEEESVSMARYQAIVERNTVLRGALAGSPIPRDHFSGMTDEGGVAKLYFAEASRSYLSSAELRQKNVGQLIEKVESLGFQEIRWFVGGELLAP